MRYGQLVIGPAGSGKSTYCKAIYEHCVDAKRRVNVVNLDPAAEHFGYTPMIDIRQLIHVNDVMADEELHFGPNGGLVYCMEYLLENCDWLQDQLGDHEDDYFIFDCPGQIELYTHLPVMRRLIATLKSWNFNLCTVFLVDVQFMTDGAKFLSGTLAALSAMVNLELPHVNLLTKMDLLNREGRKQLDKFLEPDAHLLLGDLDARAPGSAFARTYLKLSEAIGRLVDDYSLVKFVPLNIRDEENVGDVLLTIDNVIQYGEDEDVRTRDFEGNDADDE